MEHLVHEVARLALQVQIDIADLRNNWSQSNESVESVSSTVDILSRIERKLGDVHGDTRELIRRVPEDLGSILAELRRALLIRLAEVVEENQSNHSDDKGEKDDTNGSNQSLSTTVKSLTPQERRVFQLCFQSGFLTYGEIAAHLDITPSAAKNLVNRMLQSDRKRPLFSKQYRHGTARVGIQPDFEKRILAGNSRGKREPRKQIKASAV
ncbi:MAG: sigma factor-like helix-turn-helix DNA-binding protein [bacterium]|nr:sigma factor-like helix-turn-helix DNA-binding protein [bacterium]